jgi:hypothetical protein
LTLLSSALPFAVALLLAPGEPGGTAAPADTTWNSAAVMEIVERGRAARRQLATDGGLETYQALTEGHIYFFVDPEEGDRSLIRVDQVAVELQWQAPDLVRQRIVGERSETRLPVKEFRYYLDRLTLVQYGFGDEIQVGSGMDVAGVPHPLAPLPLQDPERAPYDFRISDSLTLRIPGREAPLALVEVSVRPRDPSAPGVLGTLLIDRGSGSIVRMDFTFTPASYVDDRTDRIQVEVDYGLWEDAYWLPNRQLIEVRREVPELDIGVGTIIRAVLRVGNYDLNVPLTRDLALVPPVTWAPEEVRGNHLFTEGLMAGIERDGLAEIRTRTDPREIRAQAMELLRNRPPSGLSPLRLHLPRASSALRYNRAEGAAVGAGASFRPSAALRLRAHAGYAFGSGTPGGEVRLDGVTPGARGWELRASHGTLRDLGLRPGAPALFSSLGALVRGEDYLDPWETTAASASLTLTAGAGWITRLEAGVEAHRSLALAGTRAPLDASRPFRPVHPVADGTFALLGAGIRRATPWPAGGSGTLELAMEALSGNPGTGSALEATARGRWADPDGSRELELWGLARSWAGDPLPQGHRLSGGRHTVPGYPFRSWSGLHHALVRAEAVTDLRGPIVRLRGGLHAGWTGGGDPGLAGFEGVSGFEGLNGSSGMTGSGGVRPAVTLGLGLGWDLVRLDLARGLRDGEWQLLFSIDPAWWDQL